MSEIGVSSDEDAATRRIAVRTGSRLRLVALGAVDWMEADGDYAHIHAGRETHLVAQRMQDLERVFRPAGFARIHRSLLVNVARVRELQRDADGSGSVVLHDGVRLRVARNRWEALERALRLEAL